MNERDSDEETTEAVPWSEEYDVVVVGGGGAGMAAAVSASERGADVLLLQKIQSLGGSTTMAVGSFSAAETRWQADAGIEDDVEAHVEDIQKFVTNAASGASRDYYLDIQGDIRDRDAYDLKQAVIEEGADTLEWLRNHGCEYTGPYPEAPHRVPRMHLIQPDSGAYADNLGASIEELGIDVEFGVEVYELVTGASGVEGVIAKHGDRTNPFIVGARKGVVLATGSYIASPDLRSKFTTNDEAEPINDHNSGDGHRMAVDAGAQLVNMDLQGLTMRFGDPLYTAPDFAALVDEGAIIVNGDGKRFINEVVDYDQLYSSTLRQPGDVNYVVMDSETAERFTEWPNYISTYPGIAYGYLDDYRETSVLHEAKTVAEVGRKSGLGDELAETVESYNETAEVGQGDLYGRTESLKPLAEPPYFVLGPVRPYSVVTDGGVAVDTSFQVLDTDGQHIDGLYAAGSVAGGALLSGHGHHHLYVFTSGCIAGRTVAARET